MKASKHIETQRLGTLSNTIFGVAMTLLAYGIPTGQFLNGPPVWSTIWAAYHSQIAALLLSFVVAGMFWFGHQRRLAYEPLATRSVVYLNLLFLLSIIALPITTGLYGTYWDARDVIVLYCGHLAVIGGLHAILWLLVCLPRGQAEMAIASIFVTGVLIAATFVALVAPVVAQFILNGAFAVPVIEAIMEARRRD